MTAVFLLVTIGLYFILRQLHKHYPIAILNPVFLSIIVIAIWLLCSDFKYQDYKQSTSLISFWLDPAVVALAYPLYLHMNKIRKHYKAVFLSCLASVVTSLIVSLSVAMFVGAKPELLASIAPKAVTTAIAMPIAKSLGGLSSLTAVLVILSGILGAVCGPYFLTWTGVRNSKARGLAMGASAHALGTARAIEEGIEQGAFSSAALVLCGVITAILAPIIFFLFTA